jgi:hypothetical protein
MFTNKTSLSTIDVNFSLVKLPSIIYPVSLIPTFSITGDLPISSGSATICGYDVTTDINSARRFIGYCPQFDALIDCMTPREHLVRT